jgi:DNA polymerase-3 subunit alpha
MIGSIKLATTKQPSRNGHSRYANFDLEDPSGIVRCICWPEDYARLGESIKSETVVLVKGRTDARGREPNIIANKIYTMAEAEKEFTRQVIVKFRRGYHTEQDMRRTRDILARYPGKTPVMLFLDTWEEPKESAAANGNGNGNGHSEAEKARTGLRCIVTTPLSVTCSADLRRDLADSLGNQGFRFLSAGEG